MCPICDGLKYENFQLVPGKEKLLKVPDDMALFAIFKSPKGLTSIQLNNQSEVLRPAKVLIWVLFPKDKIGPKSCFVCEGTK